MNKALGIIGVLLAIAMVIAVPLLVAMGVWNWLGPITATDKVVSIVAVFIVWFLCFAACISGAAMIIGICLWDD
jgi:hypothetical protein